MKKDWNFIEAQILQEITVDNFGLNIFSKVAFGILTRYIFDNNLESNIKLVFSNLDYNLLPNIYNALAYNLYSKIKSKQNNNIVYKNIINGLNEWKGGIDKKIEDILLSSEYSNEKVKVEVDKLRDLLNCVAELLLGELKEVESDFIMYLDNKINTHNFYLNNSNILASNLLKNSKTNNKNINCNILSFNYTEPWGQKFNFRDNFIHVNLVRNIHGTLKNKNIIFGVDDNIIDADSESYRFTKVSRIMEMNTIKESMSTPINVILDKSVSRVVFYGHSLSDADYGYFRIIFDEYVKKENVCFEFCYTVFEGTTEKNEIIKLREGISRLFGRYEKENYERKYILKDLNLNNRIKFREIPKLSDENKLKN